MGDSDSLFQAAMNALRAGDSGAAAESLAALTRDQPQRADAWLYLGVAQAMGHHDAEAEASLRRAIELAPGEARAHYNLARLQQRRGDHAAARSGYQRALEADPGNAKAREALLALDAAAPPLAPAARPVAAQPTQVHQPAPPWAQPASGAAEPTPPWASSEPATAAPLPRHEQPATQTMQLSRVAPGSIAMCAAVMGALVAVPTGLLRAVLEAGSSHSHPPGYMLGVVVGGVLFGPILAAVFAAPAGALHAVFYNFVAARAGGVQARLRWRGSRLTVESVDALSRAKVAALVYLCWLPLLCLLMLGLFGLMGAVMTALPGMGGSGTGRLGAQLGAGMLVAGVIVCVGLATGGTIGVWLGSLLWSLVYNLVASLTGGVVLSANSVGRETYQLGVPQIGVTMLTLVLTNLPFAVILALFLLLRLATPHSRLPGAANHNELTVLQLVNVFVGPVLQTLGYAAAAAVTGGVVAELEPV